MSFDFSKLNNLKKNELYRDEYYYKINEEKQREQQEENNNYSKNNSIWEQVQSIANGLGKNIQNIGLGLDNGISYFRQQLERNTRNNAFNNVININNDFLQEQLNKNPNNEKAK